MVVAGAGLVERRAARRLHPAQEAGGGEGSVDVIHRLGGDGAQLVAHRCGDGVGGDVGRVGQDPQGGQPNCGDPEAGVAQDGGRVGGHGRHRNQYAPKME